MSIYATSDLHGLPVSDLEKLLQKGNFSPEDRLYILGDVIDRENDGGVEILKWLLDQPNVKLLLGNHEAMLLSCDFLFHEGASSPENFSGEQENRLRFYRANGGDVTLKTLLELRRTDEKTLSALLGYLRDCPLYETVSAGGKDFLLLHGGLGNFSPVKKLSDYTEEELLWHSPMPEETYFGDVFTVLGHTPTLRYGMAYKGKIFRTETWADLDVGVPYGNAPVLLRLDDWTEFYL